MRHEVLDGGLREVGQVDAADEDDHEQAAQEERVAACWLGPAIRTSCLPLAIALSRV
jgi:hypothetical protein